jgi:hypothetical protein
VYTLVSGPYTSLDLCQGNEGDKSGDRTNVAPYECTGKMFRLSSSPMSWAVGAAPPSIVVTGCCRRTAFSSFNNPICV